MWRLGTFKYSAVRTVAVALILLIYTFSKGGKSVVMPSFGVIGNDNDTNDNDGLAAPCYW